MTNLLPVIDIASLDFVAGGLGIQTVHALTMHASADLAPTNAGNDIQMLIGMIQHAPGEQLVAAGAPTSAHAPMFPSHQPFHIDQIGNPLPVGAAPVQGYLDPFGVFHATPLQPLPAATVQPQQPQAPQQQENHFLENALAVTSLVGAIAGIVRGGSQDTGGFATGHRTVPMRVVETDENAPVQVVATGPQMLVVAADPQAADPAPVAHDVGDQDAPETHAHSHHHSDGDGDGGGHHHSGGHHHHH